LLRSVAAGETIDLAGDEVPDFSELFLRSIAATVRRRTVFNEVKRASI